MSQVDTLARAFIKRLTWPSMHWKTQSIDYPAAEALAKVAIDTFEHHADACLDAAHVYVDHVTRLVEMYRGLVMDTPEDQEIHRQVIETADKSLALFRANVPTRLLEEVQR